MKSPWKFLAQLTSRRRPAETRESSIEHEADTETGESQAPQTSALPLNSTKTSGGSEHDDNRSAELVATTTSHETEREVDAARVVPVPVDDEEVQAPSRRDVGPSRANAHALLLESETSKKSPPAPPTKRPGRGKRTRTDMVAQSAAVAHRDQGAPTSSSREAFFDEVAGLDEEIKQLRTQLAQKLHLQNVQLKKMLARFDAS